MSRIAAVPAPHTYITDDREDAQILDFVRVLEAAGNHAPRSDAVPRRG